VDSVIARIVDPTNIGGEFASYKGPIEFGGRQWQRDLSADEEWVEMWNVGVLFGENRVRILPVFAHKAQTSLYIQT